MNKKINQVLAVSFYIACLYSTNVVAMEDGSTAKTSAVKAVKSQWHTSASTPINLGVDIENVNKPINRFIVKYRSGVSKATRKKVALQYSMQTIKQYKSLPSTDVVIVSGNNPSSQLKKFRQDPNVEYIERDQVIQLRGIPNDARFNEVWSLQQTSDVDINAPEGWNTTTGNRDYVLAILDTGVTYRHVDLADNMWRNPGEIAGNGLDDDDNGYIDDIYGIDTGSVDTDPDDDEIGHGTHVAGTIGATGNNEIGISGVNQVASLLACKMFGNMLTSLESLVSIAVECLDYVWDMKVNKNVNIIASNASWGWRGKYSQAMYDALAKHRDAGILFVTAAGNSILDNDALVDFPSSYDLPNIISVAAHNLYDEQALFSNYGKHTVHISAPGENILSTIPVPAYALPPVELPTQKPEIFFDDLENGVANWVASLPWALIPNGYDDSMSWTDSPEGNYSNNADVSLQSPIVDLSAHAGQPLMLSFMVQYDFENKYDKLFIEMSGNKGVDWISAGTITGASAGWEYKTYVIPETMKNVQFIFRFKLVSDPSITAPGATIDNIGISVGAPVYPIQDYYAYKSGTSMAAPHVVGALGLLKSQDPTRNWKQLKNLIIAGGVPMQDKNQPTMSNRRLRLVDINGQGSMSCENQAVQARLRPTQDIIDIAEISTSRLNLSYLNINCSEPAGNVTATVRETGQEIILLDDGVGYDQILGDGVYSTRVTLTNITTASVMVDFPNGDVLTIRISSTYSVRSVPYVSRDLNTPEIIETGFFGFSVITPPFALKFDGETHPLVYVYQHGFVGLKLPRVTGVGNIYNLRLPARHHETLIAPFWTGLVRFNGNVVHQTFGIAPNREFVLEWQNMTALFNSVPSTDGGTFQIIFFENSNDVLVNYKDVTFGDETYSNGALATIGLQTSSSLGVTYSYEKAMITDGSALLWEYIPAPKPEPTAPTTPEPTTPMTPVGNSDDGGGSLFWLGIILLGYRGLKRFC